MKISGEIARQPEMTLDGVTLVLCHELGHHFGGFAFLPADNPLMGVWAAAEGQSDYFATQVCARKIWGEEREINAQARATVDAYAKQNCDRIWQTGDERDLCYRTMNGVKSMIATMASLKKVEMPNFATPDPKTVTATKPEHPEVQCRMDTSFQGALCPAKFTDSLIPGKKVSGGPGSLDAEKEAAATSCMSSGGWSIGLRPGCWFKARL